MSQVNLDVGLMDYFQDSKDEIHYGEVRLQPLAYQDDIMRGCEDVLGTQIGNTKLAAMLEEKGLEAHPDKTCFIVCGNKKYKESIESNIKKSPLMFGEFAVQHREYDRYLGQILHGGGLDRSAEMTVTERVGRLKGATREVKAIIEDFQMQAIGGMMAAWELWEKAMVPSLLSGAGTWFGLKKNEKAIDMCDDIQNYFWRVILCVPESCPKIALRCKTGMLGMKWRIWEAKMLLLKRITMQNTGCLARQVYEESVEKEWPGLGQEVRGICSEVGISDINNTEVTKEEIKDAIKNHHYKDMKAELDKSKKLSDIKHEDFSKVQTYFSGKSVENTRMAFRVRSHLVPKISCNFKNKYKNSENGLTCSYCKENVDMSQSHCLQCEAWVDLRSDLDLTNIEDMVAFFRRMLKEMANIEEGKKHCTTPYD